MPSDTFDYLVFGLRVRSELPLPELLATAFDPKPDVNICFGKPPSEDKPRAGLQAIDGGLLLVVPDVGRYFINHGSEIIVDPDPGVPEANVRLFLLGSAMGALLHQRGLLPLHANAVEIDGKAFAFMGQSGAGKSTLAAWFHDKGYRILADDVCVVQFDADGKALAMPGLPRLRLWREALEASGRDAGRYNPSYAGDPNFDKYDVPMAHEAVSNDRTELGCIYLLEQATDPNITQLQGVAAADAVMANTYRGGYVPLANKEQNHWSTSIKLVHTVPIFLAQRRWGLDHMDDQCGRLLDHARTMLGQA